jgi:OPA family sugar phosphate sensor protein UhpC-like MFS transporter
VSWRNRVFLAITLGYTMFYVTRLSTSVSKDAMINAHVLTIGQAGVIDSVWLVAYAIGKTVNGFFADRRSVKRFFAGAMLISALANLAFGMSSSFPVFIVVWAINGWVLSAGVPLSGVVMARWFPARELGTRYSIWSMAHPLGEGLTFLCTARLVGVATSAGAGADAWRAAFLGPGVLGLVTAFVLYRALVDRPEDVGQTPAASTDKKQSAPLAVVQREVITNPWIWLCGVASALVYVSRYALNHWGVLYLQKACDYSLDGAGAEMSIFSLTGLAGTLLAGPTSDWLARGRRVPVAVVYGILLCASLALLLSTTERFAIHIALACGGFAMGGLLVFLGGLLALELCSKRAAGFALGVIGGLSYLGAGAQSLASSWLIDARSTHVGDVTIYDFSAAKVLWLGAPIVAVVLTLALWRAERVTASAPASTSSS